MSLPKHHPATRARERGTSSVEFALILPVMLVLLFGVMEYGWMLHLAAMVNNAARDGARVGARADASTSEAQAAASARMNEADLTGFTVHVSGGAATGDVITVEIIQPYDGSAELLNIAFIPVPETLQASVSMRKEGP